CGSVAGQAMIAQEGTPAQRMWLLNMFPQYIRHEVVPAIRTDCGGDEVGIIAGGASIGAFHAVAVLCRFPNVFTHALCASGTYKIQRFLKSDDLTQDFLVSSPIHFLPHLGNGPHLEMLRTRFVLIASGEGRAEAIAESWAL